MGEYERWLTIIEEEEGTKALVVEAADEAEALYEGTMALATKGERGMCCGGTPIGHTHGCAYKLSDLQSGDFEQCILNNEDSKYYVPEDAL